MAPRKPLEQKPRPSVRPPYAIFEYTPGGTPIARCPIYDIESLKRFRSLMRTLALGRKARATILKAAAAAAVARKDDRAGEERREKVLKAIADYRRRNPHQSARATAKRLAPQLGVSERTIERFCQKMRQHPR